jgi:hypothetical protein
MSKRQTADGPGDVEACYAWVANCTGSIQATTVWCSRDRARAWIENTITGDGEWEYGDWQDVLDAGTDTGIVEWCEVRDAAAILVKDEMQS